MADTTIPADHHHNGLLATSPVALLFLLAICTAAFVIFSLLQITSTEQTIFDLLQIGVQLQPNLTGDQVQALLTGSLNHNQTIATAIGWAVQFALLMLAMPPEMALAAMHRKYNTVMSFSLAKHAQILAKIRTVLIWTLLVGDVCTDFYYVVAGHQLVVMNGWVPSISGSVGVLLVGVIYPAAVCFVTVFSGKYMFAYFDSLFDVLKRAYSKPTQPTATKTASSIAANSTVTK